MGCFLPLETQVAAVISWLAHPAFANEIEDDKEQLPTTGKPSLTEPLRHKQGLHWLEESDVQTMKLLTVIGHG
jgi:hypothetical protein